MLRTKTLFDKKHKVIASAQDEIPKKVNTLTEENLLNNLLAEADLNKNKKNKDDSIDNISFSLDNASDINELYEKMSNKSDEKFDIQYEGNADEVEKQMNEYVENSFRTFSKEKKGFEPEIKSLAQALFEDIGGVIVPDLKPNANTTNSNLGTKTTNLFTKYPNISQDEQQVKLRNDLSGVQIMVDVTQNTGYGRFGGSKLKDSESNKQTVSSKEKDVLSGEDNNVEVKQSKKKKNNESKGRQNKKKQDEYSSNEEDGNGLIGDSAKNSSNMS